VLIPHRRGRAMKGMAAGCLIGRGAMVAIENIALEGLAGDASLR